MRPEQYQQEMRLMLYFRRPLEKTTLNRVRH